VLGIKGLALQLETDLLVQTQHHRIRLLIGQKIPEGRATKKSGLIVAGHDDEWLQGNHYRLNLDREARDQRTNKKVADQDCFCSFNYGTKAKNDELRSATLNFLVRFGAVPVTVQMFLASRGLGHADGQQHREAGDRENETGNHA
jgi:hypothetical protein